MANGILRLKEASAPASAPGYGLLYVNSSDKSLHLIKSTGVDVPLAAQTLAGLSDVALASPAAGEVMQHNGTAWVNAVPASSGMDVIADTVLAADAANIGFSSISQAYRHLMLVWALRGTAAVASSFLYCQFNGTGANTSHWNSYTTFNAAVVGGNKGQGQVFTLAKIPADTGPANGYGRGRMMIPDYTHTGHQPSMFAEGAWREGGTTSDLYSWNAAGTYDVAGAVSQITFSPGSLNLKAGSRITVYGLK